MFLNYRQISPLATIYTVHSSRLTQWHWSKTTPEPRHEPRTAGLRSAKAASVLQSLSMPTHVKYSAPISLNS